MQKNNSNKHLMKQPWQKIYFMPPKIGGDLCPKTLLKNLDLDIGKKL